MPRKVGAACEPGEAAAEACTETSVSTGPPHGAGPLPPSLRGSPVSPFRELQGLGTVQLEGQALLTKRAVLAELLAVAEEEAAGAEANSNTMSADLLLEKDLEAVSPWKTRLQPRPPNSRPASKHLGMRRARPNPGQLQPQDSTTPSAASTARLVKEQRHGTSEPLCYGKPLASKMQVCLEADTQEAAGLEDVRTLQAGLSVQHDPSKGVVACPSTREGAPCQRPLAALDAGTSSVAELPAVLPRPTALHEASRPCESPGLPRQPLRPLASCQVEEDPGSPGLAFPSQGRPPHGRLGQAEDITDAPASQARGGQTPQLEGQCQSSAQSPGMKSPSETTAVVVSVITDSGQRPSLSASTVQEVIEEAVYAAAAGGEACWSVAAKKQAWPSVSGSAAASAAASTSTAPGQSKMQISAVVSGLPSAASASIAESEASTVSAAPLRTVASTVPSPTAPESAASTPASTVSCAAAMEPTSSVPSVVAAATVSAASASVPPSLPPSAPSTAVVASCAAVASRASGTSSLPSSRATRASLPSAASAVAAASAASAQTALWTPVVSAVLAPSDEGSGIVAPSSTAQELETLVDFAMGDTAALPSSAPLCFLGDFQALGGSSLPTSSIVEGRDTVPSGAPSRFLDEFQPVGSTSTPTSTLVEKASSPKADVSCQMQALSANLVEELHARCCDHEGDTSAISSHRCESGQLTGSGTGWWKEFKTCSVEGSGASLVETLSNARPLLATACNDQLVWEAKELLNACHAQEAPSSTATMVTACSPVAPAKLQWLDQDLHKVAAVLCSGQPCSEECWAPAGLRMDAFAQGLEEGHSQIVASEVSSVKEESSAGRACPSASSQLSDGAVALEDSIETPSTTASSPLQAQLQNSASKDWLPKTRLFKRHVAPGEVLELLSPQASSSCLSEMMEGNMDYLADFPAD